MLMAIDDILGDGKITGGRSEVGLDSEFIYRESVMYSLVPLVLLINIPTIYHSLGGSPN